MLQKKERMKTNVLWRRTNSVSAHTKYSIHLKALNPWYFISYMNIHTFVVICYICDYKYIGNHIIHLHKLIGATSFLWALLEWFQNEKVVNSSSALYSNKQILMGLSKKSWKRKFCEKGSQNIATGRDHQVQLFHTLILQSSWRQTNVLKDVPRFIWIING